jgi:succinate dehydrogenase/fumarate reductase-like Fe-S protein
MTRGYRGFLREFTRTGSWRAVSLQVRTGALHLLRQLFVRRAGDPVAQFLAHYGPDGVRAPDSAARSLALDASRCLVCGMCSLECARVGGTPPLDPREAVIAASRLETDLLREGLTAELAAGSGACASCDACSRVCPAQIPVHRVQARLATLR